MAFDARAVSVAAFGGGLSARRLRAFVRVPLGAGELTPSPSGPNVPNGEGLREALRRGLESLGLGPGPATLVLPDGVARLALVPLPPAADARDFVRFRLGASLPWPASELIVDALPAGRGGVVGAAVRRGLVAEYERVASAAGLLPERVHLAPLLAVDRLLRSRAREGAFVVLGDAAACFVVLRHGSVLALRDRRRDASPGEAGRLLDEADRVAHLAGLAAARVRFVGSDAPRLRLEAGLAGDEALPAAPPPSEASEAAWLPGAVA